MTTELQKDKRLLLIGLNEFNASLLKEAAQVYNLQNLKKIFLMHEAHTITDDIDGQDTLEPWVQWVSIQTGIPSGEHKVRHLGDIPRVEAPQIWETLSDIGISSGIWGALNASRGRGEKCLFFIPDPWTFSENGFPDDLEKLMELPRYLAKNYLNISKRTVLEKAAKLLNYVSTSKIALSLLVELPKFLREVFNFRGQHFIFIAFTDYLLAKLFVEHRKKYKPQFSFIFLNSVAHLQHHHWRGDIKNNKYLKVALEYSDRTLGLLLNDLGPSETCIIAGGLSQTNTAGEVPWIIYRQKDQMTFLEKMGLNPLRVEAHMTHDAHIFFETLEDCMRAEDLLSAATIRKKRLFQVEAYREEPLKLFYRIDFSSEVFPHEEFKLGGKVWRFSKFFEAMATRTGKHVPHGAVFTNATNFPEKIYNHQIADYILGYFLPEAELGLEPQIPYQISLPLNDL